MGPKPIHGSVGGVPQPGPALERLRRRQPGVQAASGAECGQLGSGAGTGAGEAKLEPVFQWGVDGDINILCLDIDECYIYIYI